jgi:hypothetical protein
MIPEVFGRPPTLYESIPGTFAEMQHLFVRCLEQEFGRLATPEKMNRISQQLTSLRLTIKLHTLFSESALRYVSGIVFSNKDMLDFILSLTDNFYINLSSEETVDKLVRAIGMVAHSTPEGTPNDAEGIRLMMDVAKAKDRDSIVKDLKSASWLVTVIMIVLSSRSALNVAFSNEKLQEAMGGAPVTDPIIDSANYVERKSNKN